MKSNIKKKLRSYSLINYLLSIKNRIESRYLSKKRAHYIPQIRNLIPEGASIISSNCFAGRILQDLSLQYNKPTLGLYFMYPDYIEFLCNLEYYLKEAKISFVERSKYPIGNERRNSWSHWYPIGLLDGKVEIHFLHYHTEQEAAEKWYRRASRVNFSNLIIIGMEQNLCSIDDIVNFDKLPYNHKYIFTSKNLPSLASNIFMEEFKDMNEVGDPYKKGHIFYKYLSRLM